MPRNDPFQSASLDSAAERLSSLGRRLPEDAVANVAQEVLSRVARRRASPSGAQTRIAAEDQIDHLSFALIDGGSDAGLLFIQALQGTGVGRESLCLDYLAEAARRLGAWWQTNDISLVDVTLGTSRIYAILHALDAQRPSRQLPKTREAIFVAVPGESHTLGVRMAADILREEGWSIDLLLGHEHEEMIDRAEQIQPAVIGLSSGGMATAGALARSVVGLRIAVPETRLLIAGRIVEDAPEVVADIAPEASAVTLDDAREALTRLWDDYAG